MVVVIQEGPSTSEFAKARELSRTVGDAMMKALMEDTGGTELDVRRTVVMVGIGSLNKMRDEVAKLFPDSPKAQNLLLELIMLGYGWSAMATFYELTIEYTKLLDELNGIKTMPDNDLPPTKEKG